MRRAVALVVVLAVAAALARLEPGHRRHAVRVVAARRLQHGPRHRRPLRALSACRSRASRSRRTRSRACRGRRSRSTGRRCRSRSSRPGRRGSTGPAPRPSCASRALAPGVRPPSPSTTKTLTSSAPASLSATASPAAGGMPWPDGPVLNFRKRVLPSISAWPGSPPRRRSLSRSSQVSAQRPSSGKAKARVRVALGAGAHHLVQHRQRGVDERHGVAGRRARSGRRTAATGGGCPSASPPTAGATANMWTFEREPPGWPLWR